MGSSESKMCASKLVKPEPAIKNMSHLVDPRSPSVSVDRTPIQVRGFLPRTGAEVKSESPLVLADPRSPSAGIARTPIREAMRATVGSFARRLGMLFHSETDGRVAETPEEEQAAGEGVPQGEDQAAAQPLLSPQLCSLAEHTNLLDTPAVPSVRSAGDVSPFLLLAEPQLEVELETEADLSVEEAEEAKESPLHNRLSLSLITCREGAMSSQVFADVHCDSLSFLAPSVDEELQAEGVDHSYARPVVAVEPETLVEVPQPTDESVSPDQVSPVLSEDTNDLAKEASSPSAAAPPEPAAVLDAEQPQPSTKIPCLKIDPKSPSQVVFKPQWLGNGFGTNKPRAKSVQQGQCGKGGSSPLAVRVAVRNMSSKNKGQSGKRKQKGADGRSPLQILKGANSPRSQRPQMKLKVSTPEKQRLGQVDSRLLPLSLDKENR